jgi:hypothetical protein
MQGDAVKLTASPICSPSLIASIKVYQGDSDHSHFSNDGDGVRYS